MDRASELMVKKTLIAAAGTGVLTGVLTLVATGDVRTALKGFAAGATTGAILGAAVANTQITTEGSIKAALAKRGIELEFIS